MNVLTKLRGPLAKAHALAACLCDHQRTPTALIKADSSRTTLLYYARTITTSSTRFHLPHNPINGTNKPILKSKIRVISKNLTLKYAAPAANVAEYGHGEQTFMADLGQKPRPLVVLMVWLTAQEKNVEKYRQIYLKRGFDVLTVRTSPVEFMFPVKGAQKVARSVIDFLLEASAEYKETVVHVFSIGLYQWGELLAQVRTNPELAEPLRNQIKGFICDSGADVSGAPFGIAKSFAPRNRAAQTVIEGMAKAYMKMMEDVATKHYRHSQDSVFHNPLKTPALLLLSRRDPIATPAAHEALMASWDKLGIPYKVKWWTDTDHAAHYKTHPSEYESLIVEFLKSINIHP